MVEAGTKPQMEYRYLGRTGLKVSILSFGNMVSVVQDENQKLTTESVKKVLEYGVNYFDTAEYYGYGQAEILLGNAFKELNVKREDIVVSTKVFYNKGINQVGLSRKHIIEGTKNCLKRLQLDYVDIIMAHRSDMDVPLEEVLRAFSWLIDKGFALYWGTSEWPADLITEAIQMCQKLKLHEPVAEQTQYNMLHRDRPEKEYRPLYERYGYGTMIWSPLAKGILAGKYNSGDVPEDASILKYDKDWSNRIQKAYFAPTKKDTTVRILKAVEQLSLELGYSQVQVALAWLLASSDVSTVLLGFSKTSQIDENMKALELYKKWTKEIEDKCEQALNNTPEAYIDYKAFAPIKQRRIVAVLKQLALRQQ